MTSGNAFSTKFAPPATGRGGHLLETVTYRRVCGRDRNDGKQIFSSGFPENLRFYRKIVFSMKKQHFRISGMRISADCANPYKNQGQSWLLRERICRIAKINSQVMEIMKFHEKLISSKKFIFHENCISRGNRDSGVLKTIQKRWSPS